jgi:hypothetical protein
MMLFKVRPNLSKWKPVSNFSDSDEREAYKRAAKKVGVEIRIAYPVPAPAGADYCNWLGMKGVYIRRSQADQEDSLVNAYHEEKRTLSQ